MAKQVVKSGAGLIGKLGAKLKKAVEAHKDDEVRYSGGGSDLPGGIENGIARLVLCKFGVYEKGDMKGEYYFRAQGVVVSPKVYNGIPIEGLRTSIGPEPMCDTPNKTRKTVEEHVDWVLNELRKLGIDTSEMGAEDLETTAEALQEDGPYFRFRTWQGQKRKKGEAGYNEAYDGPNAPDPRVNHSWAGAIEGYDPENAEEGDDEVVDNTDSEEVEEAEEEETDASEEVDYAALGKAADKSDEEAIDTLTEMATEAGLDPDDYASWKLLAEALAEGTEEVEEEAEEEEVEEEEAEEEEEEEAEEEEVDLDDLAKKADSKKNPDEDAAAALNEHAIAAGIEQEDIDNAKNWAAVVEMINAASEGEEEEAEEEAEEEEDLAALGAAADESDADSIDRLTELAEEAGIDTDLYGTWAELAEALAPSEGEEEEEEEEAEVAVGSIYYYKPPKAKKAIECEVVLVGKTTVSLKSLDDGKIMKAVPMDELVAGE